MKKSILLLPFIPFLPLSAQTWEAGVFGGQQAYKSVSNSSPVFSANYSSESKTVYGFRLGRSIVDIGPVLFMATAGFQPETSTRATITEAFNPSLSGEGGGGAGSTPAVTSYPEYKSSHVSVGAMFTLKAFVSVGAGVECRFEKLTMAGTSANYARPWARANAGIAVPSPILKPFIGLEVAVPLVTKSLDGSSNKEDIVKAMAPKSQVGVYAGIRF